MNFSVHFPSRARRLVVGSVLAASTCVMLVGPAGAQQVDAAASCSGTRVIVGPGQGLAVPSPLSVTVALTEPIAAGTYLISGASQDPSHPNGDDQTAEQWKAVFGLSDGTTSSTGLAPDLAREMTMSSFSFGEVTLAAPATSIIFTHGGNDSSANSIFALCVGLTIKLAEPTTTTTLVSEVTTTVTTTVATTVASTLPAPTAVPVLVPVQPTIAASTVAATTAAPTTSATAAPTTPTPTTLAPTTLAPATTAAAPIVEVEVQGISVSSEPIAFTGATSDMLTAAGIALLLSGLLVLGRLGQTRISRRR